MNDRINKDNTYSPDIIITLFAILIMSCFYHGIRALVICTISAASCYITEVIALRLQGKKIAFHDYSAVITGLIIGLMMPASVSYSMVAVTCVIAVAVGKHVFGGSGCEIFNPAAVGFVFAAVCWPLRILKYPITTVKLGLENYVSTELVESFSSQFNAGNYTERVDIETLLGYFNGPIGCTQILVIFVCAVVLILRRSVSFSAFAGFLGTYMAVSFLMPALTAMDIGDYMFYELSSNMLVFSAVFIVADYRFLPSGSLNRFIFGVLTAVFALLFRRVGDIENPTLFAILLANPFADVIDDYRVRLISFIRSNSGENADEENIAKKKNFFAKLVSVFSGIGSFIVRIVKDTAAFVLNFFKSDSKTSDKTSNEDSDAASNDSESSGE